MLVTMFTDASLIDATRSGGWAVWAKSQRGTFTYSGPLKGQCFNTGEAELKAIANGLALLAQTNVLEHGDELLIQADNLQALYAIGHKNQKRKGDFVLPPSKVTLCAGMKQAQAAISLIVSAQALKIRTRHVKAHSGTGEPRLWVHDLCDRKARRAARMLHAERSGGKRHA